MNAKAPAETGFFPGGCILPTIQLSTDHYVLLLAMGIIAVVVFVLWRTRRPRQREGSFSFRKLAECEDRYQSLVQTSNDWLWEVDANLNVTYSSPQILTILGFAPEEVIGKKPLDFMPPQEAHRVRGIVEDAIRRKIPFWKLENECVAKDGRRVHLESNGTPILDRRGRLLGFRGVNRDVTDRHIAEQVSAEYRRRMESLIGNLFGLAYRCVNVPDWPMEFISRGCLDITGYSPMDFVSRRVTLNQLIHPDDRQQVWNNVQRCLAERKPFDLEYRLYDRGGKVHWVVERGCGIWEGDKLEALEGLIVDITEHKNAQQELQKNREFLESVIRSVPTGISVTVDRVFVSVNQRYCEMFGYAREELIGASTRMLFPSQEAYDDFGRRAYGQMQYAGSATLEVVLLKKNGQRMEVLLSGAPVDPKDWSKGITFNLLDVTDRNRANRQLSMRVRWEKMVGDISASFINVPVEGIDDRIRQSLDMLIGQLEFERVRLALIDPDSGRLYLSSYFGAASGPRIMFESDDLDRDMPEYAALIRRGETIWWPHTPDDVPVHMKALRQFCHEKGVCSHLSIPMTIGQEHLGAMLITHIRGPVVMEEDAKGYLRVVADTLANAIVRKRTLGALADSERRFRSIVESSPMGILMYQLHPDGRLVFSGTNPAASKILGTDVPALVGKTMEEAFPELAKTPLCQTYRRISLEGGSYHGENFDYVDDRIRGIYEFEAFQTSPGRMAVMFTDITGRRMAEQGRERLMRQLRIKNEELESVVYIASHDLKSPLVNIRGFSGELNKSLKALRDLLESQPLSDEARGQIRPFFETDFPESMNFINAGTAKMEAMLNGLLRLSRIGAAQSRPECLHVNGLLEQILRNFKYLIKEDEVTIDIAPDLPDCMGDSLLISQVFSNLIDNAIKYRSPDRPLHIRVEGRTDRSEVEYCVRDNGIGIASEHINKVFEIFHQLNPGRDKTGQGLGLTIVRKIVESQDGRVWIESVPGQGTTVFIRLPRPHRPEQS